MRILQMRILQMRILQIWMIQTCCLATSTILSKIFKIFISASILLNLDLQLDGHCTIAHIWGQCRGDNGNVFVISDTFALFSGFVWHFLKTTKTRMSVECANGQPPSFLISSQMLSLLIESHHWSPPTHVYWNTKAQNPNTQNTNTQNTKLKTLTTQALSSLVKSLWPTTISEKSSHSKVHSKSRYTCIAVS